MESSMQGTAALHLLQLGIPTPATTLFLFSLSILCFSLFSFLSALLSLLRSFFLSSFFKEREKEERRRRRESEEKERETTTKTEKMGKKEMREREKGNPKRLNVHSKRQKQILDCDRDQGGT